MHTRTITSLAASLLISPAGLASGPACDGLPNGSFADGLEGWAVTPIESSSGDAGASATASLVDGTGYGGADFDESIVSLQVAATTGVDGNGGAGLAEVTLSRTAIATGERLRVTRGGGFEFVFQGLGGRSLVARIDVTGPRGELASSVLYESDSPAAPGCEPGLSILGTLDGDPPTLEIDLAAAGIGVGDEVMVSVTLRATASAASPCQWTQTFAVLLVDDFEFCSGEPADVTGDGVVDVQDLVAVITSWGTCPSPPEACVADVDNDGVVGVTDLIAVILAWD